MHKRLDGSQNCSLVDTNTLRQAHTTSPYQYSGKIHHSNGLDITIAVFEHSFHNAPSIPPFLTEHAGARSSTRGCQIHEANIPDTIDDLALLPSAENMTMHNAGSTWAEADFDFNVQNLSTNDISFFHQTHAIIVVSPSTIFPVGLSPLT